MDRRSDRDNFTLPARPPSRLVDPAQAYTIGRLRPLKAGAAGREGIGLAIMTELPMVIIDVQRGGPSTGLPTKTEQADLNQVLYGRNSESPLCVLAACTPADCFDMAIEAFRIATEYMTPVVLLTDGYLANGAEPWRIPVADKLPRLVVNHPKEGEAAVMASGPKP